MTTTLDDTLVGPGGGSWAPPPPPPLQPPPPPRSDPPRREGHGTSPIRPGSSRRPSPIARLLLTAGGVDRDVLDEVPEERHRYVGIGGTVVATAGLAAGSMTLLAGTVLGVDGWAIVVPAVLWGLFIFNLDRWLISSTHGTSSRWMLIPRFALAILLGIVVAEPVVLWVFRSAIDEEIATQRTEALATIESDLKHCNPTDASLTVERQAEDRCDGVVLNVAVPAGQVAEIAAIEERLDRATADRDALRFEEIALNDRLQRERAGEGGGDTTGDRGDGPIAAALAADLDDLRARLVTAEQLVVGIEAERQAALEETSSTSGTFSEQIEGAIADRLAEEEEAFSEQPGLLERLEALGDLTGRHRDLLWARVFLSLFLIALDAMPVFAKAMSGKTTYDRILQARLAARERAGRSSLTAEGDDWAHEIAHHTFDREQARIVAKRRIDVARDRELLQLDTAHRADRAAHGGTDAEINEVLFEDGPTGSPISVSWEQPADEDRRGGLRWILGGPRRAAGGFSRRHEPDPPAPAAGPADPHDDGRYDDGRYDDGDADDDGDGYDDEPPVAWGEEEDPDDEPPVAWGEEEDPDDDTRGWADPPAAGTSWFDDVTRVDVADR